MNTYSVKTLQGSRLNYDTETIIILTVDKIFPSAPPTEVHETSRITCHDTIVKLKTYIPKNDRLDNH